MFYEFPVTVSKNTPSTNPLRVLVPLVAGVVTTVELQFPDGCKGLAHAKIYEGGHQVWPTNSDGNISGDNARIIFDEHHELAAKPYTLELQAWNDDDSFSHTITFRFSETPADIVAKQAVALSALIYLDTWFRGASAAVKGSG